MVAPHNRPTTYIVELPLRQVQLLAQLLYIGEIIDPDNPLVGETLEELRSQTACVRGKAHLHGVFPTAIEAPSRAVKSDSFYFVPLS